MLIVRIVSAFQLRRRQWAEQAPRGLRSFQCPMSEVSTLRECQQVGWTASSTNLDRYEVQIKEPDATAWVTVASAELSGLTFNITDLSPNTEYEVLPPLSSEGVVLTL